MIKSNSEKIQEINYILGGDLIITLNDSDNKNKIKVADLFNGRGYDCTEEYDSVDVFIEDAFNDCSGEINERLNEIYEASNALEDAGYEFYRFSEWSREAVDEKGYGKRLRKAMEDWFKAVINDYNEARLEKIEQERFEKEQRMKRAEKLMERI